MAETFDVIVAGAGMAGTVAAAIAAGKGAKVLLLDKNKAEEPGKKTNWGWVCGDAVAETHIQYLEEHIGLKFWKPELDLRVDGVVAYSPDLETKINFDGAGYILDRPEFEKKLRDKAVANGAVYIPQFDVEGPIVENDYVVGIFGKDKDMKHTEYRAKVVVDALGISTNLRRKLPENPYVDRVIDVEDLESTGRYIYDCEVDGEDLRYYDPKYAIIHLHQEIAPGGYGWVFPKSGKGRVNIGIGVQRASLMERNKKFGKNDTLHSLMDEYVRWNKVLKNPKLFEKDGNGKGYWSVAVRRQMECLVYNGYIGAGDSMAMPNPISAGGIGPALLAGVLAGQNAARAAKEGDASIKSLWQYNLEFNEIYGKRTAGMEVFRTYLQSLNNELINYGMKNFLSKAEAREISYGMTPELSMAAKLGMALKGLANIDAFKNLVFAVDKMRRLNKLYDGYPKTMEAFGEWRKQVAKEMDEVKARFKPNPV